MNTTSTAIAVALAVVVIGLIFIFPGFSPFDLSPQQPAAQLQETTTTNQDQTSTTTTMSDVTQLQITDQTVGTGAVAEAGDSVTVNYVGSLTNGQVFDASANHGTTGFTFTLGAGQVIAGWDQGVAGMKVGGKRTLVIPPAMGYGSRAVGPIPADSTLVFQVELVNVQKGK
jgi:FKBP-type peptidyl-prolyl cis-trans isomerase